MLGWLNEFHSRVVGSFSVSCRLVLVLFRISGLGHKQPHKITQGLKVANWRPFRHLLGSPALVKLFI